MDELRFELHLRETAKDVANSYFELYLEHFRRNGIFIADFIRQERRSLNNEFYEVFTQNRYLFDAELTPKEYVKRCKSHMGMLFVEMLEERIAELQEDCEFIRRQWQHWEPKDEPYRAEDMAQIAEMEEMIQLYGKCIEDYKTHLNKMQSDKEQSDKEQSDTAR